MRELENIVRLTREQYLVRAWMAREEEGPEAEPDFVSVSTAFTAVLKERTPSQSAMQLALRLVQEIQSVHGRTVNALELTYDDHVGVLVYPDWP